MSTSVFLEDITRAGFSPFMVTFSTCVIFLVIEFTNELSSHVLRLNISFTSGMVVTTRFANNSITLNDF